MKLKIEVERTLSDIEGGIAQRFAQVFVNGKLTCTFDIHAQSESQGVFVDVPMWTPATKAVVEVKIS